jgi:hypothetical protein
MFVIDTNVYSTVQYIQLGIKVKSRLLQGNGTYSRAYATRARRNMYWRGYLTRAIRPHVEFVR